MRLTEQEYQHLLWQQKQQAPETAEKKPSKFRSTPATVDGRTFHSTFEAQHYQELKHREKAGEIRNLACQVEFAMVVNGILVTTYRADFVFEERADDGTWNRVVSDTKSEPTRKLAEHQIKRKLLLALHGIAIREVLNERHK